MSMSADPRELKAQQRRSFDATAPARLKWSALLETPLEPISERLLDMAGVAPGDWVLDVCCGLGNPALAAARRVGAQGRVVGIDLAPRMLAIATDRARAAGLANTGFQELDAEELIGWPEAGYDAALSRFGLSFLPDLHLALRGMHRVLTPGSRVAAANWGPPDRVPFLSVGVATAAALTGRPPPDVAQPGPFALATPGVLEQALSSAGFRDIQGERVTVVFELPSAGDYVTMLREATSVGQLVAEGATVPADEVWAAIARAAAPYAGEDGKLSFPCWATCVSARR